MKQFCDVKVAPDVLLRALAIAAVVFNHAAAIKDRPFELGGGLNILLLLSGYSFARFTLTQDSAAGVRHSIIAFGRNLFLPCLALTLLSFAALRQWSWWELLFISNFHAIEHIALYNTWYPQVILQMMVLFYIVTFIPNVMSVLTRSPLASCVVLLLVSFAGMFAFAWSTSGIMHTGRMVPYTMWNFVIGAVAYFAVADEAKVRLPKRIALVALTAVLGLSAFGLHGDFPRAITLISGMAVMILVDRVPLPRSVARVAVILSQATFTIFLFHVSFLRVFDALHLRQFDSGFHIRDVLFAFTFAMAGTVAIWIGLASLSRAWRFELSNQGTFNRSFTPVLA